MLDIAQGLAYLHSVNVIHGDLKGVRQMRQKEESLSDMPLSSIYLSRRLVELVWQILVFQLQKSRDLWQCLTCQRVGQQAHSGGRRQSYSPIFQPLTNFQISPTPRQLMYMRLR